MNDPLLDGQTADKVLRYEAFVNDQLKPDLNQQIDDPTKIFIEIGLGFYLELSLEEAIKYIDKKVACLEKEGVALTKESTKIKASIKLVLQVHELLESWEELNPKIQGLIDEIDDNSRQLTICRKTTIRDTLLYQKFPSIQRELECKIYWCVESKFQELIAHLHLIEKLLKDLIHECQENLLLIKDHDSLINSTLERDNPTVIDWIDEILLHSKFNLIKINKFVSDDYPRSVPIDGVSLKANLTLESGWV
ncbi:unnamed protein product [Lepeophtheirus salmonis]|uniref:(salmon louse) hypothetical protein n=1 Tax=Lepeophtheirus salmonis TaxID=72036 RepID=A0A7R8CWM8_LEPSM|nr:unnamed protein product [Lepeophtheirus salmonis]CAF2954596.1 unnamed protein product [Lepeophtheirus salmonis]